MPILAISKFDKVLIKNKVAMPSTGFISIVILWGNFSFLTQRWVTPNWIFQSSPKSNSTEILCLSWIQIVILFTFHFFFISNCWYRFISNYWYLKVNFLIPENLLWDVNSLRQFSTIKYHEWAVYCTIPFSSDLQQRISGHYLPFLQSHLCSIHQKIGLQLKMI